MRITVHRKLIMGFTTLIILIAIIGSIALINLNKINLVCHHIIEQAMMVNYSNQIEISILECRRAEKNFWLRQEDKYIKQVEKQVERLKKNIILIKETAAEDLDNQLDEIHILVDEYYAEFLKSAALFKSGLKEEEVLSANNRFVIISRQLQGLIPPVVKEIRTRMEQEVKIAEETQTRADRIIIMGIIAAVISGFLIAFFISRNIAKSVDAFMQTMQKIEEGDLYARIGVKSRDELGVLGDYFNKILDKIDSVKNAQLRLQQHVANAEKLASLGRLSAGIAHELNNPLTGILTSGHILLKNMPEESLQREDAEIIVKETTRCRKIIKEFLNFARQSKPEMKLSDINKIIEESLSLVKNRVLSCNIQIIKELSLLPLVLVDADQIHQVFINILLNAQEAMPDAGSLTISSHHQHSFIEIKFIDTGCGIAQENMNRLFDPFFTTKEMGTGLGLAVSYGIIEKHQGRIAIESIAGEGTTVIIRLPVSKEAYLEEVV